MIVKRLIMHPSSHAITERQQHYFKFRFYHCVRAVQYSTVQYSTVQYSTVLYSTVRTIVAVRPLGATVYTKYVDPAQKTANVVPRSISAGIAWKRR